MNNLPLRKNSKTIIGMAHIGALPGSPLYDADGGPGKLVEGVLADLEALQEGGVDAILFGNENDRPYQLSAPGEGIAAMSAIIGEVRPHLRVPFGVNFLWDPAASVAIAAATGAAFVREIFTGVFASDMGLWSPDAARAVRLRRTLGRNDLQLFYNINAEFAHSVDQRPLELRARSAVFSSLADAVLVSGPLTGQSAATSDLRSVAEAVPEVPVLANTGVNRDNVGEILSLADGCIVGTHFKVGGDTWKPVEKERVARFMETVDRHR